MESSLNFQFTKSFFENQPACLEFFKRLKPGTDIILSLDKSLDCTCSYQDGEITLSVGTSAHADLKISILAEGIKRLHSLPPLSLPELGLELTREWVAHNLELHLLSRPQNLFLNGYPQALASSLPELAGVIYAQGLMRVSSLISALRG